MRHKRNITSLFRDWVVNSRGLYLSKQVHQWFYFNSRIMQHTPLIIYQMGKVASQSMYYSLRKVYPGVVVNTHTFNSVDKDWRIRKIYEHCVLNSRPLNIISLTREPVERNISAFFQNFERDTGIQYKKSNLSMTKLKELFLENYNHDIPLKWFDENIKINFGIDVYSDTFPEYGFCAYTKMNYCLLILRSELEDEVKRSAIMDFLDLSEFAIDKRNISSSKEYAETYRIFSKTVKLQEISI